ncbi:MAG: PBP1A family penicillin-binding protein [Spirochaetia bacterium]|nr:PBP1A family penicillin-binding protein [Spirochaetia bacterium]
MKFLINKIFNIHNLEKVILTILFTSALIGGIFLGFVVSDVEYGKLSFVFSSLEKEGEKGEKRKSTDIQRLESFKPAIPTRIYDINQELIAELFQHKRELVKLEEIPRSVIAAFLAVEDHDFYSHFGIDFTSITRAMVKNIMAGRIVQGGSTLTQQLVKGLYTTGEKTVFRKLYEAVLALQVEKVFSKDEILEMYLNQIYLGHGVKGIATASKFYFDKPVQQLSIIEGAILAGLPKAPHSYSPFRSPHESRKKNKDIIKKLTNLGYINEDMADELYDTFWRSYWDKIIITPSSKTAFGAREDKAPYFTEYVRQELIENFGEEKVYSKGLKVYTALDLRQQKVAEELLTEALEKQDTVAQASNEAYREDIDHELFLVYDALKNVLPLPEFQQNYSIRNDFRKIFKETRADSFELLSLILPVDNINKISKNFTAATREIKRDIQVQGAFLALEHKTGRITAMIGGREFKPSDQYNRALFARRQPGSAFKPFVYGAAFEDRLVHYAMGFTDSPILNVQPDGSIWAPSNYEGGYRGYVHLNKALAYSKNLVSIQVYDLVGPDKIVDFAGKLMKIDKKRFQKNPSLALGASEVTPFELLSGFSVVANNGQDIIPHSVIYVTDRDGKVYNTEEKIIKKLNQREKDQTLQIIEPGIAWILKKLMKEVVSYGTASASIRETAEFKFDAAGKTGTTSSWNDAWFAGFTDDISAVVWVGMDKGSMTLGKHQSGGKLCAPVWGKFMKKVYEIKNKEPEKFDMTIPEDIITKRACKFTGKWPNEECDKEEDLEVTYILAKKEDNEEEKKESDNLESKEENTEKRELEDDICDCEHTETKNFLELLQEQSEVTDEELGKTKNFFGRYGRD